MSTKPTPEVETDPVIDGIVDLLMDHYKIESTGAVDFARASAAFAQILAEMIGPQEAVIGAEMRRDFLRELDGAVRLAALRASVVPGGVVQ